MTSYYCLAMIGNSNEPIRQRLGVLLVNAGEFIL